MAEKELSIEEVDEVLGKEIEGKHENESKEEFRARGGRFYSKAEQSVGVAGGKLKEFGGKAVSAASQATKAAGEAVHQEFVREGQEAKVLAKRGVAASGRFAVKAVNLGARATYGFAKKAFTPNPKAVVKKAPLGFGIHVPAGTGLKVGSKAVGTKLFESKPKKLFERKGPKFSYGLGLKHKAKATKKFSLAVKLR